MHNEAKKTTFPHKIFLKPKGTNGLGNKWGNLKENFVGHALRVKAPPLWQGTVPLFRVSPTHTCQEAKKPVLKYLVWMQASNFLEKQTSWK